MPAAFDHRETMHGYASLMSLDDAINSARLHAERQASAARQVREDQERQRVEAAAMLADAVQRLTRLGGETFSLVRKAKWYEVLRSDVFEVQGHERPEHYRRVTRHRCWAVERTYDPV